MSTPEGKKLIKEIFIPLISEFVENKISAREFQIQFFRTRSKYLKVVIGSPLRDIYEKLFMDAEDYYEFADPNDPEDIDGDELRRRCAVHLANFKKLVE